MNKPISALLFAATLLSVALLAPLSAVAQEQVYLVLYAKFKPGKAPEAIRIIREHFVPVDMKIGRKPIPFDFMTGDWDHVVFFPYDSARMDTIPGRAEWWKALEDLEGGPEKAQKIFQAYMDLQSTSKMEIAKSPFPLKADLK